MQQFKHAAYDLWQGKCGVIALGNADQPPDVCALRWSAPDSPGATAGPVQRCHVVHSNVSTM